MNDKQKVIIVDIDGTISDSAHRNHFLESEKKDWDSFFKGMDKDEPIDKILRLTDYILPNDLIDGLGDHIIFVTGRPEKYRLKTITWLRKYVIDFDLRIIKVLMRPYGDFRPSYIFKEEKLSELKKSYEIVLAIDDNPKDCEMYQRNGITTLRVMR